MESLTLTPEQLDHWLDTRRLDRHWLADRIHTSKRTIDNWFSDGKIPDTQQELIPRIMHEHDQVESAELSRDEYVFAVQAMERCGVREFPRFQHKSVKLAIWLVLRDLFREGTAERRSFDQKLLPESLAPYIKQAIASPSDEMRLTFEEYQEVDRAMRLAGYDDFDQFIIDAIRNQMATRRQSTYLRAAEESGEYKTES